MLRLRIAADSTHICFLPLASIAAFCLLLLALVCAPLLAHAQNDETISTSKLEQLKKETIADNSLTESEKEQVLHSYTHSISLLGAIEKEQTQTNRFRTQLAQIPKDIAQIRKALAQPLLDPAPNIEQSTDREELKILFDKLIKDFKAVDDSYSTLSGSSEVRDIRRTQVLAEIDTLQTLVSTFDKKPSNNPDEKLSARLLAAKEQEAILEKELLSAKLETLKAELPTLDAIKTLVPLQVAEAKRRIDFLARQIERVQTLLKNIEKKKVNQEIEAFEKLAAGVPRSNPLIRDLLSEIRILYGLKLGANGGLLEKVEKANNTKLRVKRQLDDLNNDASEIRHRFQLVGASRGMAKILLALKNELPLTSELKWQESELKKQLLEEQIVLFRLEGRRESLTDPSSEAERLLKQLAMSGNELDRDGKEVLRKLATLRSELIDSLLSRYPEYVNTVSDSLHYTQRYHTAVERAENFIRPRVLWVPVGDKDLLPSYAHFKEAFSWVFNAKGWSLTIRAAIDHLHQNLALRLFLLVLFSALLYFRSNLRKLYDHYGSLVSRYSTDSIWHTLKCFGIGLIRSLPIPLTVWLLGSILSVPIAESEHGIAFGHALQFASLYLYIALVFYEELMPNGLGRIHFLWPDKTCDEIQANMRWFIVIGFFLIIFSRVTLIRSTPTEFDSLGRLIHIVWLLVVSFFLYRVLGSKSELGKNFQKNAHTGSLMATYRIWSLSIIYLPLLFMILGIFGYQHAAKQFIQSFYLSLALVAGLFLLSQLLDRWLLIARREAAIKKTRAERLAKRLQSQAESSEEQGPELDSFEEEKFDIPKMDANTKTLFRSGIGALFFIGVFLIWADTFPALQILSRIQIWPEMKITSAAEEMHEAAAEHLPTDSSETTATSEESSKSTDPRAALLGAAVQTQASDSVLVDELTLLDLLLAAIILLIVYIATKNLPSLIEIMLFQQLQLDKGVRYAASTLTRYAITLIGVSLALSVLGITWSSIQWLAAALTFGLAFGLQEIFANFISGIIVLFEQPVRIGDTVTIGTTNGIVTRIRMRATTVTTWERKELIIPNKQFVTTEIINWTLSDSLLRAIVPVGIAYGSDTKKAIELLHKIAAEHKKVLHEPKAEVLFRAFGASSLDFELRVFVSKVEDRFVVVHELLYTIDQEFRKANIEIAFPQRDLHIRSADAIIRSENVVPKGSPV